jgi:hypothetical protein
MNITWAKQFFSTNKSLCRFVAVASVLSFSAPAIPCGGEPDYLGEDMLSTIEYDPLKPRMSDVLFIWRHLVSEPYNQHIQPLDTPWISDPDAARSAITQFNGELMRAQRSFQLQGLEGAEVDADLQLFASHQTHNSMMLPIDLYNRAYSWGVCDSNTFDSLSQFYRLAISDRSLPNTDLKRVLLLRAAIFRHCGDDEAMKNLLSQWQSPIHPYDFYLKAIAHFYTDDYANARRAFESISADHALGPLALYMVGRTWLREGQLELSGDNTAEEQAYRESQREFYINAKEVFEQYLHDYPRGDYVASAQGLIRRAQWLAGQQDDYRAQLNNVMRQELTRVFSSPTWTSDDQKTVEFYLTEYQRFAETNPRTLQALHALNRAIDGVAITHPQKKQAINTLQHFLIMHKQFEQKEYGALINVLNTTHQYSTPHFMLLFRSLEARRNVDALKTLWQSARTNTANPVIAENASNELARIVVAHEGLSALLADPTFDHPDIEQQVQTNTIKLHYLSAECSSAPAEAWIQQANWPLSSKQALFEDLATRYLFDENIPALTHLFAQHNDEVAGRFSAIRTAVKQLENAEQQGKAFMNIGYFMQSSITPKYHLPRALVDGDEYVEPARDCRPTVLHNVEGTAGPYYYYLKALQHLNKTNSVDEVKTLHFITLCFKSGSDFDMACQWGYRNIAKDEDADWDVTSYQAFQQLHQRYKDSEWAKKRPIIIVSKMAAITQKQKSH